MLTQDEGAEKSNNPEESSSAWAWSLPTLPGWDAAAPEADAAGASVQTALPPGDLSLVDANAPSSPVQERGHEGSASAPGCAGSQPSPAPASEPDPDRKVRRCGNSCRSDIDVHGMAYASTTGLPCCVERIDRGSTSSFVIDGCSQGKKKTVKKVIKRVRKRVAGVDATDTAVTSGTPRVAAGGQADKAAADEAFADHVSHGDTESSQVAACHRGSDTGGDAEMTQFSELVHGVAHASDSAEHRDHDAADVRQGAASSPSAPAVHADHLLFGARESDATEERGESSGHGHDLSGPHAAAATQQQHAQPDASARSADATSAASPVAIAPALGDAAEHRQVAIGHGADRQTHKSHVAADHSREEVNAAEPAAQDSVAPLGPAGGATNSTTDAGMAADEGDGTPGHDVERAHDSGECVLAHRSTCSRSGSDSGSIAVPASAAGASAGADATAPVTCMELHVHGLSSPWRLPLHDSSPACASHGWGGSEPGMAHSSQSCSHAGIEDEASSEQARATDFGSIDDGTIVRATSSAIVEAASGTEQGVSARGAALAPPDQQQEAREALSPVHHCWANRSHRHEADVNSSSSSSPRAASRTMAVNGNSVAGMPMHWHHGKNGAHEKGDTAARLQEALAAREAHLAAQAEQLADLQAVVAALQVCIGLIIC
jgi:hypothetical protein